MTARIDVSELSVVPDAHVFAVQVVDDETTHTFTVEVSVSVYEELTHGRMSHSELVREAFVFLLERESPSEILPEFSIEDIGRYFPDFRDHIQKHLDIS